MAILALLSLLPLVAMATEIRNNAGETFSYKDRSQEHQQQFAVPGQQTSKIWPFGPVPPCSASILLEHDNFVAARLPGKWVFNTAVTDFLSATEDNTISDAKKVENQVTLSFTDDPSVLAGLTEDKCVFLKHTGRTVFKAGTFGIHSATHGNHLFPYVLIDHHGTSVVVYWPSEGPTAIPMLAQLAPGMQTEHDLLIIGEDVVGKPFGLLHREGVAMTEMAATAVPLPAAVAPTLKAAKEPEPEPEFNLASFMAEQGVALHSSEPEPVVMVGNPMVDPVVKLLVEVEEAGDALDVMEPEPVVMAGNPMVDPVVKLLVEAGDAMDDMELEPVVMANNPMVDPVVKLLVEVEEAEDALVE
jgi:hypothetical protein